METAKAARERRARAPEELIKKTRARNSGAVGMRATAFIQACQRFRAPIPSFDTQANWETDMISKSFKLPKGQLNLSAALFTASMIAMWSGTAWIFVFVLLR